ncbi:hypothetical protein C922_01563 [Plasmodium inui San Antonio 1]|uniref:tRNA (adenine(58)-N(1))-methyltransferase non-catalytic subunit TRM6 n=1 Tax=Plasmodium inui San Antonio 1 TaxID=1237626 RepID=W7AR55_9APIC|nr:hypothetical protein C922_01563 [Plasmodium inui San Antonio 1]EUD67951.1 hypothetical protein C922_01563 [Plasmodium inui San Antonio 1]
MKIRKHDFVLIDDELKCRLHKVVDMKIKIKKNYLNLMFLVNKKYGSTYTHINNKWVRSKKKKNKLDIDFYGDIHGTNKDIFQNSNSQRLTEENIAELKDNVSENPYEVIQKLVTNSSTYKDKTVISKFKYVEKKLKRHLCQFTVYECSIVNLINFYYKYFPEKVSSVRVDYLSNLLFHLNRDVLVIREDSQHTEQSSEEKEETQKVHEETEKSHANGASDQLGHEALHSFSTHKPNVIIYDDSFGLLTSMLNIIYSDHVNIFSLIHKNASNSIVPTFGIPKSTNVAKISILQASHAPRLNTGEWLAIDGRCQLVGKAASEEVQVMDVGEADEVVEAEEAAEVVQVAEMADLSNVECRKRRVDHVDQVDYIDHPDHGGGDHVGTPPDGKTDPTNETEKQSREHPSVAPPPNKRAKKAHGEADNPIGSPPPLQLQHMLINHMNNSGAEAFVVIISSDFLYNTNTDVSLLIDTLIKVSLKFLKNDSKLIIHTDDLNLCSLFLKGLMGTSSFINIKLNEFVLREQQVLKRRTHPVIKNAKLADGFLLTALKVEGAA